MADALLDFVPAFCPNCGVRVRIVGAMVSEYCGGLGHTCIACGCKFQYRAALGSIKDRLDLYLAREKLAKDRLVASLCEYCGLNPAIWRDSTARGVCGDCATFAHGELVPIQEATR